MKKLIGGLILVLFGVLGWQGVFSAEPSIYALATQDPNLTQMISLIEETGLSDLLDENGPFTLVAPSNAAFSQIELSEMDITQKRQLVLYHVVRGSVFSAEIDSYTLLGTAYGQPIHVLHQTQPPQLNGKVVLHANETMGGNGIIHTVDAVLFPDDVIPAAAPPTVSTEPVSESLSAEELFMGYEGPRDEPRVYFELDHLDEPIGIGPAARVWDSAEFQLSVNVVYDAVRETQRLLPSLNDGATDSCEAYFNAFLLVAIAPKFSDVQDVTRSDAYERAIASYLDRNSPLMHYCLNGGTFSQFNYNLAWVGVNEAVGELAPIRLVGSVALEQATEAGLFVSSFMDKLLDRTNVPFRSQP